jgi:hypothetical protein
VILKTFEQGNKIEEIMREYGISRPKFYLGAITVVALMPNIQSVSKSWRKKIPG